MGDWQVPGYAEESELGRGGSGRVVAAVEQSSGDRVAVKYLSGQLTGDEVFRDAFRGEAEILARLDVPHVARVRRYVESEHGAAIIMDLVSGAALRRILAEFGPASPRAALSVLKGSLQGLAGAHQAGIVHRDYKPENVIVDQAGSSMLVDFGIALRAGTPGNPSGTPGYAAPEQWEGAPASPAGDIYAAGVTFTECVTGTGPPRGYPAPTPADEAAAAAASSELMGPRLAGVIARATAADPAARPADAAALLAELEEAAQDRYGAGWEETGKSDLARGVAALLSLAAGAAAGAAMAGGPPGPASAAPAQGPATSAGTALTRPRRFGRPLRAGGHSPVIVVSVAGAVGVIAVTGIAIAVATGHRGPAHSSPGGQPTTAAAASPSRSGHSATPTSRPTAPPTLVAVNPNDPCTWLTPADFAKNGISVGSLKPGSFPGGWRACRNGDAYVGVRGAFLNGCPPVIAGILTCTPVSVPGASSAQYLVIPKPPEVELHAERAGEQYSIGVPKGAAGSAALIRLMELVLTRIAGAT